jgi:hypothetical protein
MDFEGKPVIPQQATKTGLIFRFLGWPSAMESR